METSAVNNTQSSLSKWQNAKAITAGTAIGILPSAYVLRAFLSKPKEKALTKFANTLKLLLPDVDSFKNIKNAADKAIVEIGQALNHNNSKLWKYAQKSRQYLTPFGVPAVGLALFGLGLFHKVKPEQEGVEKSKWEKTKDFTKNNSGKIAFATMTPMMAEEIAASVKGIKIAKKYLNPQQLTRLKGNFKLAFSSYAMVGILLPAAIGLGNFVADKIQGQKA